jgi:hypothetical protein
VTGVPGGLSTIDAIDGPELALSLLKGFQSVRLTDIWIVTPFLHDFDQWPLKPVPLSNLLVEHCSRGVRVTLVTKPPDVGDDKKERLLTVLSTNGVRVKVNDRLHAKIYLFREEREGGTVLWHVGSSNLTFPGLRRWLETSMRGYRVAEYEEAFGAAYRIAEEADTLDFDFWWSVNRTKKGQT